MANGVILPEPSLNISSKDHLFISYAHTDRALAERLATDLRNKGYTTWVDFGDIGGGDIWKQAIVDGIYASKLFLFVISPDSLASEWCETEFQAAVQFDKKIIPLVVRPLSHDEKELLRNYHIRDNVTLKDVQYIDFSKSYKTSLQELLKKLPSPIEGIPQHCRILAANLVARPWGLDHYICEKAKMLPINASPYEEGASRGQANDLLDWLRKKKRLVILGEPGIGKTVALERFAWELASSNPPTLPIMIKLLEYDGKPLLEWIRLNLISGGEIHIETPKETQKFLEESEFNSYILLDGLNEVPPDHRNEVTAQISQLAMLFPSIPIVITSRVQDGSWRRLRHGNINWEIALIQPIEEWQAQDYLAAHLGTDDGKYLWQQLDALMRSLASTPLLLWLIKEAWISAKERNVTRMPENRGALYDSFIHRMLQLDEDRFHLPMSRTKRLNALAQLALAMHIQQQLIISEEKALEIIEDENVLKAIRVNGFLIGDHNLRFAPHQTVQEHFAARGLLQMIVDKKTKQEITTYVDDTWWTETFIQLAGLIEDPNELAMTLVEINPWLAWWCVQEGREVNDTTLQAIESRSVALVNSHHVDDRRRAASALVKLQTPRVIEPLINLVIDEDEETGNIAANGLVKLGEAVGLDNKLNLLQTIQAHQTIPTVRLRIGHVLAGIGDPRDGVGIRIDGLPDIDWVKIPNDGEWIYQNEKHSPLPTFYMSRYLITYAQFQSFIDDPQGFYHPKWWEGLKMTSGHNNIIGNQKHKFANHPREQVSWYDTIAFCRWLSFHLSSLQKTYDIPLLEYDPLNPMTWLIRLPIEHEWEKAARGIDGRFYPWGNKYISGYANIDETINNVGRYSLRQTTAVGMYEHGGSIYGIMDMSGNIWEWSLTEYHLKRHSDLENNNRRVVRGGSSFSTNNHALATNRSSLNPLARNSGIGFRVVSSFPLNL